MMNLRTTFGLASIAASYKEQVAEMKADRDLVLSKPYAALSAVVVALRRVPERAYLEAALQFLSDAAIDRTNLSALLRRAPSPPSPLVMTPDCAGGSDRAGNAALELAQLRVDEPIMLILNRYNDNDTKHDHILTMTLEVLARVVRAYDTYLIEGLAVVNDYGPWGRQDAGLGCWGWGGWVGGGWEAVGGWEEVGGWHTGSLTLSRHRTCSHPPPQNLTSGRCSPAPCPASPARWLACWKALAQTVHPSRARPSTCLPASAAIFVVRVSRETVALA